MTTPPPPPGIGGGDDSVERRLIVVSERLERASSDLQSLVNQLRESFSKIENEGTAPVDVEADNPDSREGDDGDGSSGTTPGDPN